MFRGLNRRAAALNRRAGAGLGGLTFDLRLRSFGGVPFSSIGPRNESTDTVARFCTLWLLSYRAQTENEHTDSGGADWHQAQRFAAAHVGPKWAVTRPFVGAPGSKA